MVNPATAWKRRLKAFLIDLFGAKCEVEDCSAVDGLQFAHVSPTGVLHLGRANRKNSNGGRGSKERIRDVRDHPGSYALLCGRHHLGLDNKDMDTILSLGLIPWYAPEEVESVRRLRSHE